MISFIAFAAMVFAAALSGAIFKPGAWYHGLEKPSWTPPDWAFPVVWTVLYVMIAVSGWLVWREAGWGAAMGLWGLQLVLNALWSALFFGMRRMDLAFVDVVALLGCIVAYIAVAAPVSGLAALLFVPYAAWVATAAMLNLTVWRMNPRQA
ncbi:MAG: sensory protein TspO [Phyllobacteriaceae bacterium]|nr:sensory protein TspO [Phyllobacteriaceae bacterium]MBA91057.1 sensory protein TspO [Phyllobacteriaceae bacterium]